MTPDLLDVGPFLRRTAGVLGLDFRGHGGSDDAPTTFGLNEVEDVAGALAWLGERGIRRVALVGSSMGGITAIAAVAVLGDGRLASADADPAAPAAHRGRAAPADRGRGRRLGDAGAGARGREPAAGPVRAPDREPRLRADGPPTSVATRGTPSRSPSSGSWRTCRCSWSTAPRTGRFASADADRLAAAAPAGSRHLVIEGAGHARGARGGPGSLRGGRQRARPRRVRRRPTVAGTTRPARILHRTPRGEPGPSSGRDGAAVTGERDGRKGPRRRRRRERSAAPPVHPRAGGVRGRRGVGRRRRPSPLAAGVPVAGPARRHRPPAGRLRGRHPDPCGGVRVAPHPDHHAHHGQGRPGQGPGAPRRRGRLPDQAVPPGRAAWPA